MNKAIRYMALFVSVACIAAIVIAILKPDNDYRYEFIVAAALLSFVHLIEFMGDNTYVREIKRSDNEQ